MGVKIRERKVGQFWVFVSHKGTRMARFAGSEETAIAAQEIIQKQIATGLFQFPRREPKPKPKSEDELLLKTYYETFSRVYLTPSCAESTRERYAGCYDLYILPRFGSMPLREITRAQVKEFVADLVRKGLAKATVRIIVSNLCTLFSHAIEDEILAANPATRMPRHFKAAREKQEIEPLTKDEVPAFLEAAVKHDAKKRYNDVPEYYPLFLCAIHTGMRAGELAGLQWGDIDLHGKFLMVRRAVKSGKVQQTKTRKVRKIDGSDSLLKELEAMRRRRREDWMRRGKGEIPEWVFCNSDGGLLDTANVTKRHFHKCLQDAKLRRIRFHDLRHTFASLLIQNGESLAYVKEQMGHSSIKVTVDVYGHLVPGANRQAVNRLPVPKSATQLQPSQNEIEEASKTS